MSLRRRLLLHVLLRSGGRIHLVLLGVLHMHRRHGLGMAGHRAAGMLLRMAVLRLLRVVVARGREVVGRAGGRSVELLGLDALG